MARRKVELDAEVVAAPNNPSFEVFVARKKIESVIEELSRIMGACSRADAGRDARRHLEVALMNAKEARKHVLHRQAEIKKELNDKSRT